MQELFLITIAILSLLFLGVVAGYFARKQIAKTQVNSAEARAEKILQEAKTKQQELLLKTKDKALQIIETAKKEEESRRWELSSIQKRLEKREALFDQKLIEFQEKQQKLFDKANQIEALKSSIEKIKEEQTKKLETIAALNQEEAKKQLLEIVENRSKEDLFNRVKKLEQESEEVLEEKAREILLPTIQRLAAPLTAESTTTVVALPNDEMKGRIIGKEGRNIKVIEQLTGTEIIIDETPEAITISGFSPIRRQIAKRALEKLIADGRIQPARIESTVETVKKDLAIEIKKSGEEALYNLGVTGIDPKLVQILGRLKFRSSYGQNILQHSQEVAYLAGFLAEELDANVAIAKKGGLFHDIGKAVDQDVQGGHPEIGCNILKKFNVPEDIAYIALGHHEDHPKTIEAILVKVADAISGARPGARRESLEQYIKRLEELESIATSFKGVEKAYAIQAGRELRIFVKPLEIDDYNANQLAKNIAHQIENELDYPGEIKVTVIRENRAIEYAR